jgi:acetylglutamate kinase
VTQPTLVIKLGGRAQTDPTLPLILSSVATRSRLALIHGGGDEISAMQRRLGLEPTFVGGRRVTNDADLDVVRMLLSGTVNKRLTAQLISVGVRAVGVSGEDASLLTARVVDPTFGRVGGDVLCDPSLILHLVSGGFVPVISPLARDRESAKSCGLNVNGDDAAAAIAAALHADDLLFLADVPGVLEDEKPLAALDRAGITDLIARDVVRGGMRAKLEAALTALERGVRSVRIGALSAIADPSLGTHISLTVPSHRGHP